jgi:hypothetical protein
VTETVRCNASNHAACLLRTASRSRDRRFRPQRAPPGFNRGGARSRPRVSRRFLRTRRR